MCPKKPNKGFLFFLHLCWALYKPDLHLLHILHIHMYLLTQEDTLHDLWDDHDHEHVILSFLVCPNAQTTLSMIHFTIFSVQHSTNNTFCASFYHSLCAIRCRQHCSIIHGMIMPANVCLSHHGTDPLFLGLHSNSENTD